MDVVHTMITKVGGLVEIDSTVDEGSTFRIRLPLTLAILPALIVLSRDNYFAVPQDNLLEIIDIRDGLSNLRQIGGAMVYYLRGQLLPLVSLSLLTENKKTDSQANINSGYILVVQVNSVTYGLIVENLLDTEEIVVKPLGKELKGLDIFSGVTIHGNGKIAWIVDAASVAVKSQIEEQIATLDAQSSEEEENFEDIVSILRFEVPTVGSIGVDILSVLRVEQIRRSDLKTHGSRFVFSFNKEVIPVFTFGLKTLEFTTAFLIILDITEEGNSHKIALFAQEIHDVCKQAIQVTKALKEPWSVGITLLDDIPTAIIDSAEIFGCVV
jgi:two-component system chemotaxis sensor kinase CheA